MEKWCGINLGYLFSMFYLGLIKLLLKLISQRATMKSVQIVINFKCWNSPMSPKNHLQKMYGMIIYRGIVKKSKRTCKYISHHVLPQIDLTACYPCLFPQKCPWWYCKICYEDEVVFGLLAFMLGYLRQVMDLKIQVHWISIVVSFLTFFRREVEKRPAERSEINSELSFLPSSSIQSF